MGRSLRTHTNKVVGGAAAKRTNTQSAAGEYFYIRINIATINDDRSEKEKNAVKRTTEKYNPCDLA